MQISPPPRKMQRKWTWAFEPILRNSGGRRSLREHVGKKVSWDGQDGTFWNIRLVCPQLGVIACLAELFHEAVWVQE